MRSIYRDTITVYNRRFGAIPQPGLPPGGAGAVSWQRTVIKGAMWKDSTQINGDSSGASFIDRTVSVTIPFGADFGGRTYVEPSRYGGIPTDRIGKHWTLNIDAANPDIVVLGEGREIDAMYSVDNLRRDHRHMAPRAVRDTSRDSGLPMWKVTGQ